MPELPEVETTLRGIQPHIEQQTIENVVVRHYGLRWPIAKNIHKKLLGDQILRLERRGKYLLLRLTRGAVIIHLGMSGRLRILPQQTPAEKHDHVDVEFSNQLLMRFTDPRRFGAFLWVKDDPHQHKLLKNLGVEPLEKSFSGKYLWQHAQQRKTAIKTFIMDHTIVVGVGNIYANEALFAAGIHPQAIVQDISLPRYEKLTKAIKTILQRAIKQGGTTLKDFVNSAGKPGYFAQYLHVYNRAGLSCTVCKSILQTVRIGQRSTVFCEFCQVR